MIARPNEVICNRAQADTASGRFARCLRGGWVELTASVKPTHIMLRARLHVRLLPRHQVDQELVLLLALLP